MAWAADDCKVRGGLQGSDLRSPNNLPWVPEPKNNKKKKIRKERKFSSFSLFLLPISFHLNFEALVPRVPTTNLLDLKQFYLYYVSSGG